MRIIKFRVWDKEKKKWLRPSFYGEVLVGGGEVAIANNRPHNGGYTLDTFTLFTHKETDNFEISQFTGLTDKNGKEIYEGDLMGYWHEAYWKVGWSEDKGKYMFQYYEEDGVMTAHGERLDIKDGFAVSKSVCSKKEIIGNVFENPELLK